MKPDEEPWHAHVYAREDERAASEVVRTWFTEALASGRIAGLRYVGPLAKGAVGPHPLPQFEVHFLSSAEPEVRAVIDSSGLTALIHPLTHDDLADHTTLAQWIGEALPLDLSVLDPPSVNQGLPRFGRTDL